MSTDENLEHYLAHFKEGQLVKPEICAACRRSGHLHWHGSYRRSLITLTRTVVIPIKRLFCALCGHTFALLPEFILKWHRYAKEIIVGAVKRLRRVTYDAVADGLMEKACADVATLTLYLWRKKFA